MQKKSVKPKVPSDTSKVFLLPSITFDPESSRKISEDDSKIRIQFHVNCDGANQLSRIIEEIDLGLIAMPLYMERGPTLGRGQSYVIRKRYFRILNEALHIFELPPIPIAWSGVPNDRYLRDLMLDSKWKEFRIFAKVPLKIRPPVELPARKKAKFGLAQENGKQNSIFITGGVSSRPMSGGLPSLGKRSK